jgi:hypothetical protein
MIQKVIVKKVLEVVDNTIGKKFKIIDEITDLFQGLEPRIKEIEELNYRLLRRIEKLEERIDENKHSKEKSS